MHSSPLPTIMGLFSRFSFISLLLSAPADLLFLDLLHFAVDRSMLSFIRFHFPFFVSCALNPASIDFDADLLACLSASPDLYPGISSVPRRFSGMGRIGQLCGLGPDDSNSTCECFYQIIFDKSEVDRLHLPSDSFRVELSASHPLRRLAVGLPLIPLHGMISSNGTLLLRDQPTRFVWFRLSFN